MGTKNKKAVIAIISVVSIALAAAAFVYSRRAVPVSLTERYNFQVTCPTGTNGYERYERFVCAGGPEEIWENEVDVEATTARDARQAVLASNAALKLGDPAYMTVLRETKVGDETAVVVQQTNGSEAPADSSGMAKTMLVVHNGFLYKVHARENQPNAEAFFSSFRFTR